MQIILKTPKSFMLGITLLLIVFLAIKVPAVSAVEMVDRTEDATYILDEDFAFLGKTGTSSDIVISGWDVDKTGGSLSSRYYSWFKITDSSSQLPVVLKKKFQYQNTNSLTMEFRFKLTSLMENAAWKLCYDEIDGISIVTSNGNICYKKSDGSLQILQAYNVEQEYGVKIKADLDNGMVNISINGITKVPSTPFTGKITGFNNVLIKTGETTLGDMFLQTVKIYKGFLVNEKFIATIPGNIPDDWTVSGQGGTSSVLNMQSSSFPDTYSLKMNDTSLTNNLKATKTFSPQSGKIVSECKFLLPTSGDGYNLVVGYGSIPVVSILSLSNRLYYVNNLGVNVEISQYSSNLWAHIKVVTDTVNNTADIWMNGRKVIVGADLCNNSDKIDNISASTPVGATGIMWLDDVQVYKEITDVENYVPIPQVADNPDIMVGMQSCSMWREGHHLGWERILPYDERKPLLGWYDEGNPETADWEIKWLVEHGVDYEMFTWFRPTGGANNPIKNPDLGYALHDGYMNAKYSDKLKYCIMWENNGVNISGSTDFRNNVLPYWMEYYFKDSRYLKIDNKPVISIFSFAGLKRDFSSIENVRIELENIRAVCKAAGFADAFIMISSIATDSVTLDEISQVGADAIYAYSWGANSGYIEVQKSKMLLQRDANKVNIVPTLGMGRDDAAWSGGTGKFLTASETGQLANWIKDTFMPSLSAGAIGKRMVVLDNWNEFGEGHFFMPSGVNEFGYLDAIRNVFGSNVSHTDIVPDESKKQRINRLYPQQHITSIVKPIKPDIPQATSKRWDFNTSGNLEGWQASNQLSSTYVSNGYFTSTSTGTDPTLLSADNLALDITNSPYIKIKMKNTSSNHDAQLFFITDTDTVWNETKSIKFYINSNETSDSEYIIDLWTVPSWTGKLKQLRFDPIVTTGTFSIDSIQILTKVPGQTWVENSFETNTTNAWTSLSNISRINTTPAYDGSYCIQVNKTNMYGAVIFNTTLYNHESYYFSAWVKLPANSTATEARLVVAYTPVGEAKKTINIKTQSGLNKQGWTRISATFKIDEPQEILSPVLYLYTANPTVIEGFYLDDFEVRYALPFPFDVSSYSIPSGASNVPVNTSVEIKFNQAVTQAMLVKENFTLNGDTSKITSVEVIDSKTCLVHFNGPLDYNQQYQLVISNIANLDGTILSNNTLDFKTVHSQDVISEIFYSNESTSNKKEIKSLSGVTGSVTAVVEIINRGEENIPATSLLGLYRGNKLFDFSVINNSISSNEIKRMKITVQVPDYTFAPQGLKLFSWTDFVNMKPIAETFTTN